MSIALEMKVLNLEERVEKLERELATFKMMMDNFQLASVPRGTEEKFNGRAQKR